MAVPIEAQRAQLCIRELKQPVPGRTIALIWRKGGAAQVALSHIAQTIKSAYQPEAKATPHARRAH
jgi:hypothetical protein